MTSPGTDPTVPEQRPGNTGRPGSSSQSSDLSRDQLLANLPRNEQGLPTVGGIPIQRRLGAGAMGAVYYGVHPRLHVEVAVKILPFHLAEQDPKIIERFMSEARVAASLESDHVVRVLDVNCEGETYYLVMQYIDGEPAGNYTRKAKEAGQPGLNEKDALEIVIAATKGLAAAHERGIIHRDVKPDNIMVPGGKFAKAKLADLGLAKPEGGAASVGTMANVAMGTPGYMAPEQAEDAKTAGPPADVFAMGGTLYALLMARAPFADSSIAITLRNTATKDPPPLRPGISDATKAIIQRCLAKDPKRRYANGSDLLAALQAINPATTSTNVAKSGELRTVIAEGAGKSRTGTLVAAAIIAVVVIGAVAFFALKGPEVPKGPDPVVVLADARKLAAGGDYDGAVAALKGITTPDANAARDEFEKKAKEIREKKENLEKIANVIKKVEVLEKENRFDDAIAVLTQAVSIDPDNADVRAAKTRIQEKFRIAKTAAHRERAYAEYMQAADVAMHAAEGKNTPASWQTVADAASKAVANADKPADLDAAKTLLSKAEMNRDWAEAKEADSAGEFDKAIKLTEKWTSASAEIKDFCQKMHEKKKGLLAKVARKIEYEKISKQAKDEKNPAAALDLWKKAKDYADRRDDEREVETHITRLEKEVAALEKEKKYSTAMADADRAFVAGTYDVAEAKYREALALRPDDPDALKGLGRAVDLRKNREFENLISDAKTAEQGRDFKKARAIYEKALQLKPTDGQAKKALARIIDVLEPPKLEFFLDEAKQVKVEFSRVLPAVFTMGDATGKPDEKVHEVTLTKTYYMQTTEVTQAQWEFLMGSNPSKFKGRTLPVENVSWDDVQDFIGKANQRIKERTVTLPTEAEWEHACRAGTKSKWCTGDEEFGSCDAGWDKFNSDGATHPVGTKAPNDYGIFDMHGNVGEWVQDWYGPYQDKASDPKGPDTGTHRVVRGGGFIYAPSEDRSAWRNKYEPPTKLEHVGFRLVIR